ncbi:hypothetical protein [Pseudomonas sp. SWRI154]|uniref:hypothetical protein n=1 Tax=Pseudomonas sp. SWRI154 TaxID=2745501 RepID=UPI0016441C50|nr:hypothetical protein [Pseudomonas sp. SWRI154]MBC3363071.1 hypothetical protein [Pseudomonas sp. SWRI154]
MKQLLLVIQGLVSVLLFACVPVANALTRDVSAVFRPDPSKPNENTFLNTTPISGYCADHPSECRTTRMFSIRLPIVFNSTNPIQANHGDPRQGAMFNMPTSWRAAQITHASTGETETVEVRWSGLGSRYRLSASAVELVGGGVDDRTAHQRLWSGLSWVYAPAPCRYSGMGFLTSSEYAFFWKTPVAGVCAKTANYLIPGMSYLYLDFAYELRTPNPLRMSSGQYTGSITYSIGPGQDIDMGNVMLPNDSVLTLNFKLDVEHTLKIDVPPGGNRVELVPQEGWQSWLNSGRKPTRLFRDQRFHISASSRFKMALECQVISGNTCAVSEPGTGHAVPVDLSVSLPNGLTDGAGQPVNRRPLLRDGSGTELFQPGQYVDRGLGTLHFEIGRSSVEQMLDSGAKAYGGSVTVVWDSEV